MDAREVGEAELPVVRDAQRHELCLVRADFVCRSVKFARVDFGDVVQSVPDVLRGGCARTYKRVMAQELSADEELEPPVGIEVGDGGIEDVGGALRLPLAAEGFLCALARLQFCLDDARCRHDIELRLGVMGDGHCRSGGGGECECGKCRADDFFA